MDTRRTATRTRTALGVAAAVLAASTLAGCGSADLDGAPVERKSFGLDSKTLTIEAENSDVELVPADVRDVLVERQFDGWVFMGNGPDPTWEMRDGTLELGVSCDGFSAHCEARHVVKVPRGTAVTVLGDNGSVLATGFDTSLTLQSHNGEVTVREATGPLKLTSHNGDVVGERISSRKVSADSSNGAVRLGFAREPDAVDSVSRNGEITIEVPGSQAYDVTASSANGDTSVDVKQDKNSPRHIQAESHNGEITVRKAN
ncbi:DUF4097 family beta strand repeat-containing protein [Streptomyces sp. NPDC059176]|uniref:DUF4097 family beta strand repeat-containing protein n=1 Tax=unclassified Streptomyces TaxID=2593676 RepID=UPI0036D027E1